MANRLSPGIIAALVVLSVLLLVAIALALWLGLRKPPATTGTSGPPGPSGPAGPPGPAGTGSGLFQNSFHRTFSIAAPTGPSAAPTVFSLRANITPVSSYVVTIAVPGVGFGGTSRIFPPSANSSSFDLRYEAFVQRTNGFNSELLVNITGINNTTIPAGTNMIVELIVFQPPWERRRRRFPWQGGFGGGFGTESEDCWDAQGWGGWNGGNDWDGEHCWK